MTGIVCKQRRIKEVVVEISDDEEEVCCGCLDFLEASMSCSDLWSLWEEEEESSSTSIGQFFSKDLDCRGCLLGALLFGQNFTSHLEFH